MIGLLIAWEPANYIALVSVIVSPLAALGGAWLNSYLARRAKVEEHAETLRKETAQAVAPMFGILVDAQPSLVALGQLREHDSPKVAVEGLYRRWTVAREPLLVIHYGHPSEHVRRLAFSFQANVELSLRETAEIVGRIEAGLDPRDALEALEAKKTSPFSRDAYTVAAETATEFAEAIHATGE